MQIRRYRKKPTEIEAVRFTTNNEPGDVEMHAIVSWICEHGGNAHHNGTDIFVHTLEGTMRADVGDYIIRGVKGEFYPCKPDIFTQLHEEVAQ